MHTLLHADITNALEMLDHAVRLRASGNSFDLALHLDDDRGSVAAVLAQNACRLHPVMSDARLAALNSIGSPEAAIGDNPLLRFATMDLATKATVRDLAALADSLIFRSWAEMRRGVMNYDIVHRSYTITASKDERVPQPVLRTARDGSILIWAPDEPVERLYLVLTAAALTGRIVRVVAKPGDLAGIAAELIAIEDAASAIATSAVCVAASLSDPSGAIALTDCNLPICAAFTNGAQEWIAPICTYRPWSCEGAFAAITQALGMPAPVLAPSSAPHASVATQFKSDAPVSVIIRSQDGSVREVTQRSVHAQTHQAREVIVAASSAAVRDALERAQGRYVLFVDDGDILFSDHLGALVDALERSQAEVAYCGGLLGYLMDAPGHPNVLGYSVMEKFAVTQSSFAAMDSFAGTYFRVLFRSETLRKIGLHAELDALAVFAAFSRVLAQYDAVYVDRVSGMSLRLLDGRTPAGAPRNERAEYETYYRLQPAPDVGDARAAVLQHLSNNPRIGIRPPPQRLNPPRPF